MADDAPEERLRQYEALMEDLAQMLEVQQAMHQQVEECMQRQDTVNECMTTAIERLDVTQACVEILRARMLPTKENGRKAERRIRHE